ncbi:hypothetical protein [Plasmodium yoelii yoelii]|uniref:Uncharacterized protein n=1 Tax=Plasmodium yoelii yoelii TaxID=73239 RepID=Q7RMY7_PLAYO|nr:hypothetical protein [Plasmodium yoelii yoelii]
MNYVQVFAIWMEKGIEEKKNMKEVINSTDGKK